MATVLVSSRRAARARMLGGTHARPHPNIDHRDVILAIFPALNPVPRHRKEGTS